MVILSGTVHAAIAIVLVWGPSWLPRRPATAVYEVQLVSAPVEAPRPTPPRPAARVEPKPKPKPPAPPPPKPVKPKPVPKPTPAPVEPAPVKAERAPAPTPEVVPEESVPETAPEPPTPEPEVTPPAPLQASKPEPTEPSIDLVTPLMEAVALKYPFYVNALRRKINENWSPPGAGFAKTREVLVVFTIQRDGSVRGVNIEQSSGDAFYDQAALRSVLRASPFPPLPPGYSEDSMNIFFSFSLNTGRRS